MKNIAIIPNLKQRKFLGFWTKSFTIVVFENKTVFAELTSDILKENVAKARENAKGFFGKWGAQMGATLDYAKRYSAMSFEDIKNETTGNLFFDNSSISKIKTYKDDRSQESGRIFYYVDIIVDGEKYKFSTEHDPTAELKKGFPDKI